MLRVLPGGAKLSARNHAGDERCVACRPGTAVEVRSRPRRCRRLRRLWRWLSGLHPSTVEQWLKVLMALVGLIGAILVLFGWSSRR